MVRLVGKRLWGVNRDSYWYVYTSNSGGITSQLPIVGLFPRKLMLFKLLKSGYK